MQHHQIRSGLYFSKVFLQFLPCGIDHTVSSTKSRLLTFWGMNLVSYSLHFTATKKIGTVFHRTKAYPRALSNALGKHSTEVHTCQSDSSTKLGIQTLLVPQKFTVASVDNVDFLQSHAAVYSGSQHRIAILLVCN